MIELRASRITMPRPRPGPAQAGLADDDLAFRYLYTFRRIVAVLALIGASVAWVEQWPGLLAVFVCVGIGELIECSYYLTVLRWEQRRSGPGVAPDNPVMSAS